MVNGYGRSTFLAEVPLSGALPEIKAKVTHACGIIYAVAKRALDTGIALIEKFGQGCASMMRNMGSIIALVHPIPPTIAKISQATKFLSFALIPSYLVELASATKDLFIKDEDERTDVCMRWISDFGNLGDSVISIFEALIGIEAIGREAANYLATVLSPLSAACTVFSAASIVLTGRSFWKTYTFLHQLNRQVGKSRAEDFTLQDLQQLIACLHQQNNQDLRTNFNVDPIKLKKTLTLLAKKIPAGALSHEEAKGIARALHGRVTRKLAGDLLNMATTTISTVASLALFATPLVAPPAEIIVSPLCFTALIATTALSMLKTIWDYFETKHFEKAIGLETVFKS